MIEIENLTKTFGTQTVISDVSGIFYPGKIYGFVGRNGSGKTVLMKMILGFIKPTSGTIKVNGKQVGKEIDIPDDIGAIIETPGFLPEYSAFQNLKLMAMIRGKITNERKESVRQLSWSDWIQTAKSMSENIRLECDSALALHRLSWKTLRFYCWMSR